MRYHSNFHSECGGDAADNPRLKDALEYTALGLPVIPLHEVDGQGACSCRKADCTQQGKHPRTANGSKDGTIDEKVIRRWWKCWPGANVGICTGQHAAPMLSVFVVGPDGQAGINALTELEREHSPVPQTPKAKTGSGGAHHYLLLPPGVEVPNRRNHRGVPIDVRGEGGLVVAPPSRNAKGDYVWEVSLDDCAIAESPPWIVDWCCNNGKLTTETVSPSQRLKVRPSGGTSIEDRAIAYLDKMPPAISGSGGHDQTMYAARVVVYAPATTVAAPPPAAGQCVPVSTNAQPSSR
jgi:hypothetical protein